VIQAIVPMTIFILILNFTIAPFSSDMLFRFIGGAIMMIVGMALFLFGADISMMAVGEKLGSYLVKRRSLPILIIYGFVVGFVITIAEPDLQVLATKVSSVNESIGKTLLIVTVAIGLGLFLVLALLRVVFQWNMSTIITLEFIACFAIAPFCDPSFMPLAFDSGGVTTGPMTAPFMLALGVGLSSSIRSKGGNNSFGVMGMASVGPILAILILGVIFK